jgi:nicotinic acid mononucleotide adenylyltransferase
LNSIFTEIEKLFNKENKKTLIITPTKEIKELKSLNEENLKISFIPGSFNPLMPGHLAMAAYAKYNVYFGIPIFHHQKKTNPQNIYERVEFITSLGFCVVISNYSFLKEVGENLKENNINIEELIIGEDVFNELKKIKILTNLKQPSTKLWKTIIVIQRESNKEEFTKSIQFKELPRELAISSSTALRENSKEYSDSDLIKMKKFSNNILQKDIYPKFFLDLEEFWKKLIKKR